ncbi:MAG: FAD-binding protein [Acetatifactor sp.]|nr:FAD-binding protein [Acetatifactor sp.]
MQIKQNESLKEHTTFRMGGNAIRYVIPENLNELVSACNSEENIKFIGGGSNILIAEHEYEIVIDLGKFDTSIQRLEDGKYRVGASVRLQNLINSINKDENGGIEYLFSVPGLVGGAVTMNAGRGRKYNKCISDYIVSVDALVDGSIKTFIKEECGFGYRNSIFKNSNMIVVAVVFDFPKVSVSESEKLKKERIELCKENQDNSLPNFGSVFMEYDFKIMNFVKKISLRSGGCHFSRKTSNWLLNDGGNYKKALKCIKRVELLHKIFRRKCKREVIIWE